MEENMPDKPNVGIENGLTRSRRAFVKEAAAAAVLTGAAPSSAALDGKSWLAEANAEALDEALKRMTGLAQLTNHGPMAAEALVMLGRAEKVLPWVEGYMKRFTAKAPALRESVNEQNWRAALGDGARVTDWTQYFARELDGKAWRSGSIPVFLD
jgi:hypothetical protein